MKDYYKILEISETASEEVIHMAYKALVKKYHPDANGLNVDFEEKLKDINEAYSVLSDTNKRRQYEESYYSEKSKKYAHNEQASENRKTYKEDIKEAVHPKGEKKCKKWYYSYPILFITLIFYFPISSILTVLRLKDIKKQTRGYRIRTQIAVGFQILFVGFMLYGFWLDAQNKKLMEEYDKFVAEQNYTSAKEILDKRAASGMTEALVWRYLELHEQFDVSVDLNDVISQYCEKLPDKVSFDLDIQNRIEEIIPNLPQE